MVAWSGVVVEVGRREEREMGGGASADVHVETVHGDGEVEDDCKDDDGLVEVGAALARAEPAIGEIGVVHVPATEAGYEAD